MGKYNILFGLDTAFEFVHTTLGVIFQDLNSLDDSEIIRHYSISFLIVRLTFCSFSSFFFSPGIGQKYMSMLLTLPL